jgi:site-specific recombinase XerC
MARKTPRPRVTVASPAAGDAKPRLGQRGQARASLDGVLKKNLRRSAHGRKTVSHATIADRAGFYDRMIRQLHELGYKITEVRHLKPKHIEALMRLWETQGLSASTLQKRFSQLRLLCGWIGKQSMLKPGARYLVDPAAFERTYAAQYDHSWTATGLDPAPKIAEIAADDPAVAQVLRLQHAFGLRLQEASLLNPRRDRVDGLYLRVWAGTKGGRPRVMPIETEAQRAVLADAEQSVPITQRSMIPPQYDLKQWLQHCYYVLAQHGITRKDGRVSHGLRHQYANAVYEQLTGETTPVRGGSLPSAADAVARHDVAARLGHARPGITAAYYGRPDAPPVSDVARRTRPPLHADYRVQQQVLAARVRTHLIQRQNGAGPLSAATLAVRWRLLNQMVKILALAGQPLRAPDDLNRAHIEVLLQHWQTATTLQRPSVLLAVRLLSQLCGWLDQPALALEVRQRGRALQAGERVVRPCPLSEAAIQERIARIRAQDARVALHLELVRVVGLSHRQAAMLQPGVSYQDGGLDVFWETPKNQVLRYPLTGERQRAVVQDALALLPDPQEPVCPVSRALSTWLGQVYHLQRTVGRIGIPGEPTLAALKDPDAPIPTVFYREDWLLHRAGLDRVPKRGIRAFRSDI